MVRDMMMAGVLALGMAGPVAAQPDSAHVSLDLVLVLLGGPRAENAIYQHTLPADLDGAIPLGEAERVVGGLAGPANGTVVVEVPGDARTALETYVDHLRESGWRRPALPPDDRGGFRDTRRMSQNLWCGEAYLLRPTSLAFNGRTYLRISYDRRDSGRTVCDGSRARVSPRPGPLGDLSLPTLEPPPGADVRGSGGGSSFDRIEADATIASDLGLESIFDHYAGQLAEAGWILQDRALGDGAAIGRWDVPNDDGEGLVGTMNVWLVQGNDTYLAVLRVDRPEEFGGE